MQLTYEWQEYDHSYQKEFQDIRTTDGKEYFDCWPNAGFWYVDIETEIPDEIVTHVKLTKEFR